MKKIRLGKTELLVSKTAMGCLPLQRCTTDEAVRLIRSAYEGGITFFDTANHYTDSEHKIGLALSDVRDKVVLATKSMARDRDTVLKHIENSLRELKTDYIDLFQFHNAPKMPDPEDPEGAYAAAAEAKKRGWIRHIGVTTHRADVAEQCIASGNFESLQFPFSYISADRDIALAEKCLNADMALIAMKGLAGGLLTNVRACHAFMKQFDNVVPIWGIQRQEELEQWLAVSEEDPSLDDALKEVIEKDRTSLSGSFCRGCGYCLPCTVGIQINMAARMQLLLNRSVWQSFVTPEWRKKMDLINDCVNCGLCSSRCPYELDTPALLKANLKAYNEFCKSLAE